MARDRRIEPVLDFRRYANTQPKPMITAARIKSGVLRPASGTRTELATPPSPTPASASGNTQQDDPMAAAAAARRPPPPAAEAIFDIRMGLA